MVFTLLLCSLGLPASAGPTTLPSRTTPEQTATLARHLRSFVLDFLPDPLFEDGKKWGMQKLGPSGKAKNHGRWLKYRITGRDLAQTLQIQVVDLGRATGSARFRILIDFAANAFLERQTWKLGLRLYSGSTRARFHVHLLLDCELTSRVESGKGWLPDIVFSIKITNSQFRHDKVVVEHTAGVGGDAARLLGDLLIETVKTVKPNLERDLAAKVNAAILKAGNNKEVRLRFDELFGKPKKPAPQKK